MKKNMELHELTVTALGMAVVFVTTMYVKLPNGLGGYLNLGDGFLLLFAGFVSPASAVFVGGLASMLADLAGGYAAYAIPTFAIKGLEAWLACVLLSRTDGKGKLWIYGFCGLVMTAGYFLAEWALYGNLMVALAAVPFNLVQAAAGMAVAYAGYPVMARSIRYTGRERKGTS